MKALQHISISPENAIVVIVDMQNEFCKPGGKLYTEISARILPGVVSAISGLVERARDVGIPIIYIQSMRTLKEAEFTVFGQEPISKVGTPAVEFIEKLKPHKGDSIVQKFSRDSFFKTDLDSILGKLVPDPTRYYAIVTGGTTNVCVYHAVMGFFLRNYWTVVPVDCIYYLTESGNNRALEQFSEGAYSNIFLSRSDHVEISKTVSVAHPMPVPGT